MVLGENPSIDNDAVEIGAFRMAAELALKLL
jgi:hypothetical protein